MVDEADEGRQAGSLAEQLLHTDKSPTAVFSLEAFFISASSVERKQLIVCTQRIQSDRFATELTRPVFHLFSQPTADSAVL